jgi:hypothetical protein
MVYVKSRALGSVGDSNRADRHKHLPTADAVASAEEQPQFIACLKALTAFSA